MNPAPPEPEGHSASADWTHEQAIRDRLLADLQKGSSASKPARGREAPGTFEQVGPTRSARRAARGETAKPIAFSAALVRAILAGNKTETRRPMRPQPPALVRHKGRDRPADEGGEWLRCPLAQAGTMLWVREPWAPGESGSGFRYLADLGPGAGKSVKWQPGRFMPHRAARIQLSVTHVFPQRLAQMAEAEALREGAPVSLDEASDPLAWFRRAWDGLYAADGLGFDENPWVWVVRFKLYTVGGILVE